MKDISRTGYKLIALSALAGAIAAGIDAVIDYLFFYEEPFASVAISDVPTFEIYIRSFIVGTFLIYGLITAKIVTKREQLAQELEQSRKNFHVLFESLSDLLFVMDQYGCILEVNEAVVSRLGHSRARLTGRPWASLLTEGAAEPATLNGTALLQEGSGASEFSLTTREGEAILVEGRISRGHWDGRPVHFLVGRDVTDRRRAEKARREAEAKYTTLVENSLTGVFIFQKGRLVFANQKMADIYGYSKAELLGLEVWDLVHPEERPLIQERAARRLAGEEVPASYESRSITREGDAIWVQVRNVRITYHGEPAIMGNIIDVTERRLMEEELRRSERERKDLSLQILTAQENERGRMALELHDSIGQTLSGIRFFVENALQIEMSREGAGESGLETLQAVIPKLRSAVAEVRAISMALRPSTLDDLGLLPTLGSLCREFHSSNPELRVGTEVEAAESDVPDPLKIVIYRITQEALNNVVKHSGADRAVVALRKSGDGLHLTIQDNGQGFDVNEALAAEHPKRTFGIRGMRERTELTGGEFTLDSLVPKGTEIRACWPADILPSEEAGVSLGRKPALTTYAGPKGAIY